MIPDYCEAITAYRVWDAWPNGLLCGQAVSEPWPPYRVMVAHCAATSNSVGRQGQVAHLSKAWDWLDAPVLKCDCGIHAYKTAEGAETRVLRDPNAFHFSNRPEGRVWGALKIWGKVVEHADGYRAQFAYPSVLLCEDAKLAARVAKLYGVPCEVKALPKPDKDKDDGYSYATSYWYHAPPLRMQPQAAPVTSYTPQSGLIQVPALATIKSLAGSRYQAQQARKAMQAYATKHWRDVLKQAVYAVKDEAAE